MITVQPQDWHLTRILHNIPVHFIKCKLKQDDNNLSIDKLKLLTWIEDNCVGRVAIGKVPVANKMDVDPFSEYVRYIDYVAFEDKHDATAYSLFYN